MDRFAILIVLVIAMALIYYGLQPAAPFDLKYTAVDGTPVDLAQLRGKVVLVDFWATWCEPCRMEVPRVVDTYQKYHDKGFEIVGVSLDQDKDALLTFTAQNGMTWPQFFDGQGWDNAIAKANGVRSIPAMWLIGKDGRIITRDARDDLEVEVEHLVSTP
jgi:thiol-disulfide isomerase/thioredoxin